MICMALADKVWSRYTHTHTHNNDMLAAQAMTNPVTCVPR